MSESLSDEPLRTVFEAFGVPISVQASSAEVLERVQTILPPMRRSCDEPPEGNRFELTSAKGSSYRVTHPGHSLPGSSDLDVALEVLDSELRAFIAFHAPEHIFVHAGVVARDGRAIVIPGASFSGKTSLVAEFVRAGYLYYSDEFAVLDRAGLVHPYAKPLSIRSIGFTQVDHDVTALGGVVGTEPLPIGMVILSEYRPSARWRPQRRSAGDAVLALLANTVPAQERPEQALGTLVRAVGSAPLLEGERGDAAEVVRSLRSPRGDAGG